MTHHQQFSGRLHALDNLRAVMMWLGIVLHVGIIYTYNPLPLPLPWHDQKTSLLADWLVALIHSFRMPVFFILAGFFVVLLVHGRGVGGMLANRLKRRRRRTPPRASRTWPARLPPGRWYRVRRHRRAPTATRRHPAGQECPWCR